MRFAYNTHSVIARRTLVRRGNPSCLEERLVEKRKVKGLVSLSIFTLQSSLFHLHSSFPGSQWIATGYALAMTRGGTEAALCFKPEPNEATP